MQNHEILSVVRKLVDISDEFNSLEKDVVKFIDKIVSPQAPSTAPFTASTHQPTSPTLDEICIARAVGKIAAIKEYRARTGLGLADANKNIEKAVAYLGWDFGPGYFDGREKHFEPLFDDIEPIPF